MIICVCVCVLYFIINFWTIFEIFQGKKKLIKSFIGITIKINCHFTNPKFSFGSNQWQLNNQMIKVTDNFGSRLVGWFCIYNNIACCCYRIMDFIWSSRLTNSAGSYQNQNTNTYKNQNIQNSPESRLCTIQVKPWVRCKIMVFRFEF